MVRITYDAPFLHGTPSPVISPVGGDPLGLVIGTFTNAYFEVYAMNPPAANQPNTTYKFNYRV